MQISPDIYILTQADLERREKNAYQRGVERGRFEEGLARRGEKVALNCANWKNGRCEQCGVQHQYFEVSAEYKCPHFTEK